MTTPCHQRHKVIHVSECLLSQTVKPLPTMQPTACTPLTTLHRQQATNQFLGGPAQHQAGQNARFQAWTPSAGDAYRATPTPVVFAGNTKTGPVPFQRLNFLA